MDREGKKKIIRMLFFGGIIITLLVYKASYDKSYKNEAVQRGESIYLNGKKYSYASTDEKFTISNILIAKMGNRKKIYEIEEYPNYEYIAVYSLWDGTIYERVKE